MPLVISPSALIGTAMACPSTVANVTAAEVGAASERQVTLEVGKDSITITTSNGGEVLGVAELAAQQVRPRPLLGPAPSPHLRHGAPSTLPA